MTHLWFHAAILRRQAILTATCATLCAAVVLGGCSPSTPLPALRKDVPSAWRNARTGQAQLPGPTPDLDSWWKTFDDSQLNQLITRALNQNLNLQQALLRLRGARALAHRASTQFKPQLSFHTFSQPDPAATTSYYEIGFDAQWELGFFGRGLGRDRIAAADLQAAANDAEAARVSVIAEVARNYVDLRASQRRAQLLQHIVELRRQCMQLGKVRLDLHLESQARVDELESELEQARTDVAAADGDIAQAQQALAVLLAEADPAPEQFGNGPQPTLPDVAFAPTPADLLRTRPEIRAAELHVLRAAGELGIAKADLFPKLALGGTLISSTRVVGDIDRPNKAIPSAGPLIDIPLFDWGARRDAVHARGAALQAASLAYRQAVLEGVADVESALAQWDSARRHAEAAAALVTRTTHATQRTQTLQHVGLADTADAAHTAIVAAQAQLQQSRAEQAQALAYIAVYKSFGGNLPPLQMDVD